ncbi:MAG: hypothetical protein V7607_5940 [Solirubrobacteraceae bacterium]
MPKSSNARSSPARTAIRDPVESWALWRDVVCTGRFYDFLEEREGRWGLVLRQPIYEKDRLDPVDPAAELTLDAEVLGRFPAGYRHLAYAQTIIGYRVKPDMPGLTGPEVQQLYEDGRAWLAGDELPARRWPSQTRSEPSSM